MNTRETLARGAAAVVALQIAAWRTDSWPILLAALGLFVLLVVDTFRPAPRRA